MSEPRSEKERLQAEIDELRSQVERLKTAQLDQKRLEEEIKQKEAKMAATLNALPDLMFEIDPSGRIFEFRSTRTELLYLSPEDFIGKRVPDVLPEQAATAIMAAAERAGKVGTDFGATFSLRLSDKPLWFELSIAAVKGIEHSGRLVVLSRDVTARKEAELENEKLIGELKEAIARIETLSGLLPICASCKKIRDERQEWHALEVYIRNHSKADFTHGICPECLKDLYSEADNP